LQCPLVGYIGLKEGSAAAVFANVVRDGFRRFPLRY
jgi:hypothetical protein